MERRLNFKEFHYLGGVMDKLLQSRLASVLAIVLGAWLMLSPIWISVSGAALISLLIVGGIMILSGLVQLLTEVTIPSIVLGLAAVYLFISAFGFNVSTGMIWNEVVSAVIAFVLATWDGIEISEVSQLHHGGRA